MLRPVKVMIVDDHTIFKKSLARLLNDEEGLEVVATAQDAEQALETADRLMTEDQLDLVFMDIRLVEKGFEEEPDGIKCAKEIMERSKSFADDVKVIMLTSFDKTAYIRRVRNAGIAGYLLKNCNEHEMMKAIQVVMGGGAYFQPIEKEEIEQEIHEVQPTEEEGKILMCIAQGKTIEETSKELFMGVKTIERRRKKLFENFGVNNSPELVMEAVRRGFLNPEYLR